MRLLPREEKFYHLFLKQVDIISEASRLLLDGVRTGNARMAGAATEISVMEHRGDEVIHEVFTRLNQTFITPFDREDIHLLSSSLDDVLDFVNAAAIRMTLYGITNPPPAAAEIAGFIVTQAGELSKAVALLDDNQRLLEHCVEVNRLENEADRVSRRAIAELFEREKDPIQLIKIKELYEVLETATDKAEDAANVLEAVALKSA